MGSKKPRPVIAKYAVFSHDVYVKNLHSFCNEGYIIHYAMATTAGAFAEATAFCDRGFNVVIIELVNAENPLNEFSTVMYKDENLNLNTIRNNALHP